MAFLYLDTSALAKRYVAETGTAWVRGMTNAGSGNVVSVATVTAVELIAAVYRRLRVGSLTSSEARTIESIFLGEFQFAFRRFILTHGVCSRALRLVAQYPLRAYDAIQLGTALFLKDQRLSLGLSGVVFVSADVNLNQAAASEGLAVENPNHHP